MMFTPSMHYSKIKYWMSFPISSLSSSHQSSLVTCINNCFYAHSSSTIPLDFHLVKLFSFQVASSSFQLGRIFQFFFFFFLALTFAQTALLGFQPSRPFFSFLFSFFVGEMNFWGHFSLLIFLNLMLFGPFDALSRLLSCLDALVPFYA